MQLEFLAREMSCVAGNVVQFPPAPELARFEQSCDQAQPGVSGFFAGQDSPGWLLHHNLQPLQQPRGWEPAVPRYLGRGTKLHTSYFADTIGFQIQVSLSFSMRLHMAGLKAVSKVTIKFSSSLFNMKNSLKS